MNNFLPEENLPGGTQDFSGTIAGSFSTPDSLPDRELEQLRQMLFAREIALLEQIACNQGAKQFNIQKVSEVLAESIILRAGRDNQLNIALEPVVGDIVKSSLSSRKDDFVKALFPLIGPVVRKSISETFLSMLGSISQSLETAFSWRGLRWRFEAWRSGKSFSEIVLSHTVLYRVEQVFFIHSETGLPLAHVVNEEVTAQDVDMVSGMLTAVQDFVRDSFLGDGDGDLNALQMGNLSLIIEKNDMAYIACVVRGTPPVEFRAQVRDSLALMMVEYAEALVGFSGDTAPFLTAVRYLHPLLVSRYAQEKKEVPFWLKAAPVLCLFGVLFWGGYTWYGTFTRQALLEKAVVALNGQPGVIITNIIEHKDVPWEVLAFRDALAPHPEKILQDKGFAPDLLNISTVPFISYDASIILRRVKNAISPPDSVTLQLKEDGTLVLSGKAPIKWIIHSRDTASVLPGVKDVDISGLHDPLIERILTLVETINESSIEFPLGRDVPVGKELVKLEEAVDNLVQLKEIAQQAGLSVALTVYGHADSVGSEKRNYEISQARAKTVAAQLYARGVNIPVSLYGMGAKFDKGEAIEKDGKKQHTVNQTSRRIELHVALLQSVASEKLFWKK